MAIESEGSQRDPIDDVFLGRTMTEASEKDSVLPLWLQGRKKMRGLTFGIPNWALPAVVAAGLLEKPAGLGEVRFGGPTDETIYREWRQKITAVIRAEEEKQGRATFVNTTETMKQPPSGKCVRCKKRVPEGEPRLHAHGGMVCRSCAQTGSEQEQAEIALVRPARGRPKKR